VKKARPELYKVLKSRLILPNPEYHAAVRAGRTGFGIPREIQCAAFDHERDVLTVPPGILRELINAAGGEVEIDDQRCTVAAPPVTSSIELRDYQEPAVAALIRDLETTGLGLLESPPGSGKTEMALEVAARLG